MHRNFYRDVAIDDLVKLIERLANRENVPEEREGSSEDNERPLCNFVTFEIKEDKLDEFKSLLGQIAELTRREAEADLRKDSAVSWRLRAVLDGIWDGPG